MGRRRLVAVLTALAACALAGSASADDDEDEELTPRGEVTAGARLYFLQGDFDDDDLVGYFDQYRYIKTKNEDPAWFADLFHLDFGLYRGDGTSLLRFERKSPGWDNEHSLLEVDWRGIDFEFDYRRFRQSELRQFPEDTTTGPFPTSDDALGIRYNSDLPDDNPLGKDKTFWNRRIGFTSELAVRPEDMGAPPTAYREIKVRTRYQQRKGREQDRYALDNRELGRVGGRQRARFRGQRRRLDQEVHGVGGEIVLTPGRRNFTLVADADFESFREDAPDRTIDGLVGTDPDLGTGFSEETRARGLFVVPNTDRMTGSLRMSSRIGNVSMHGSVFGTLLQQSGGKSRLQRVLDVGETETTTWSAHGAIDIPLTDDFGVNGFAKISSRKNGFDRDDIEQIAPPEGQVDPFERRRQEINTRAEAYWRPVSGLQTIAGYRAQWVDRTFFTGDPPSTIPETSLIDDDWQVHSIYGRAIARFRRFVRMEGEVGFESAPKVSYARDLEEAWYLEGRGSVTFGTSFPLSFGAHGKYRRGHNDDWTILGEDGERNKKFQRTEWDYGLNLDVQPHPRLSVFASWTVHRDNQELPHLRSTQPRYVGLDGLAFYRDSDLEYDSRVRHLMVGTRTRVTSWMDVRASTSVLWIRAKQNSDLDGRTGVRINNANEIDSRVASVDAGVGFELPADLRIDLGYRFDDFHDSAKLDPLDLEDKVHTASFSISWTFGGGAAGGG